MPGQYQGRVEQGQQHDDAHHDGNRSEHLPDDAAKGQQRGERRHRRQRRDHEGAEHPPGADDRRFDMAETLGAGRRHALRGDDRVVDHERDQDEEGEQGDDVDG